ncbi:hypothetical protein ASD99_31575 [Mesorhizobium sp. Root695]|uniref:GNAT family N-acetyltransferase n=1 Tax=Mesorhizobium sp. Root695 TaxID=1736589 RepID=UPI00070E4515|nr:GNAT family N-acetyltransferase [Mesorhizobium sp. Root695]KRB15886.1 hypothetical protein ASD99_31575 [Mesorhizobium sp. Root695]
MTTIRIAQDADAEALPDIEQSAGEAYRWIEELAWIADDDNQTVERHRELIAKGTCWVAAELDDPPIAFLSAEIQDDTLHIWELAVRLDRQRLGIGRALLRKGHCGCEASPPCRSYSEVALDRWFPALLLAARRDVLVDIIWGQSSEKKGQNDTLIAANALRARFSKEGVQSRVRVHASPSRSHAKIIFADTGEPHIYQAVVGSCNWLASKFDAFETSVRLRDSHILADVAFELAELARPPDGNIGTFSTDMLAIGRQLAREPAPVGLTSTARIVLGSEHADFVLDARDNAKDRIVLLSHQMGYAMGPTLEALETAARLRHSGIFQSAI